MEKGRGGEEDEIPPPYLLAVTRLGKVLRFPLQGHREPSTKAGRLYCRVGKGDEVVDVLLTVGTEVLAIISRRGKALLFMLDDVPVLVGAGKGVRGIKLKKGDEVLGIRLLSGRPRDVAHVETTGGRVVPVGPGKYRLVKRGGQGADVVRRGGLARVVMPPVTVFDLAEENGMNGVAELEDDDREEGDGDIGAQRADGGTAQGELF